MKFTLRRSSLVLAGAVFLSGVHPAAAAEKTSLHEKLNNGYSLLYHLCDQEKPLEMIMMVKTAPAAVAAFTKKISQTAGDDVDLLERMQAHDSSIRLDDNGLPQFELDVRQSIKEDKQHFLLFETKDNTFTQALLVSQIEATSYAMHLAKVLAQDEPNAKRAAALQRISDKWHALQREAYRLLAST
jgi:hypothetical protein